MPTSLRNHQRPGRIEFVRISVAVAQIAIVGVVVGAAAAAVVVVAETEKLTIKARYWVDEAIGR